MSTQVVQKTGTFLEVWPNGVFSVRVKGFPGVDNISIHSAHWVDYYPLSQSLVGTRVVLTLRPDKVGTIDFVREVRRKK